MAVSSIEHLPTTWLAQTIVHGLKRGSVRLQTWLTQTLGSMSTKEKIINFAVLNFRAKENVDQMVFKSIMNVKIRQTPIS